MRDYVIEACAASVEDCLIAQENGAHRIELNQALPMGGLSPSIATVNQVKALCSLPIMVMVRPRGGGFHYSEQEILTMREDAKRFIEAGADGLVFGFLNADKTLNKELNKEFVDLCKKHNRDAVIHRCFDLCPNPYLASELLIEIGADRVLTSGQKSTALEGVGLLKDLHARYGEKIEYCAGAGINEDNVWEIVDGSKIKQVHSSFKTWKNDPSTENDQVSYRYSELGSYEQIDGEKIKALKAVLDSKLSNDF